MCSLIHGSESGSLGVCEVEVVFSFKEHIHTHIHTGVAHFMMLFFQWIRPTVMDEINVLPDTWLGVWESGSL